MSKFKRYKCDTCFKETDVDNNLTHAFIDRCNLTVGCNGVLRFVADKNTKDNVLNFDSITQLDRIGSDSTDTSLGEYIDAASSDANNMVLAVKTSAIDSSIVSLTLKEIFAKERAYQEFVFSVSVPVTAISGKDNSVDQKVLTFDSSDSISVFINGQELDTSKYTAENNIIRFNELMTYNTYSASMLFVKVLVYTAEVAVQKTLSFRKNVQGLADTAWSNLGSVYLAGEDYELFTCTEFLGLTLNSRLTVEAVKCDGSSVAVANTYLLLSQAPFGPLDRIESRAICLAELNSRTDHIKYEVLSGVVHFLVTSNSIKDVFPQIKKKVIFVAKDELDTAGNVGDDTSKNVNVVKNNKFILGPV